MSRKYRQRGYQDDDREPRQSRRSGPRPERQGPRGRGLGRPTEALLKCARCGVRVLDLDLDIAADAVCRDCGSDLHTCTNCAYFDSSARNQCRKEIPAPIPRKSSRNDCGLFEPRLVGGFASDGSAGDDPRSEFDALFDF